MPEGRASIPGVQINHRSSEQRNESGRPTVHANFDITVEAGKKAPELGDVRAVTVGVQSGRLRVGVTEGNGNANCAGGGAIRDGSDASVLAENGACGLATNQSAILGAGNSFTITNGAFIMENPDDVSATVQLTAVVESSSDLEPLRCWICPYT